MVESGINFFFDTIKWVFNDFLIRIKIFDISLLYYFIVMAIMAIVINGILNPSFLGSPAVRSYRSFKSRSGDGGNKK